MEPQKLYQQDAAQFTLRFFVKSDTTVNGQLALELADAFFSDLVFAGCRPTALWTKAPGMDKKPNIGEFAERRWQAAAKKIRANENAVLRLEAQTADFPNQKIDLLRPREPAWRQPVLQSGTVEVTCSVPYLQASGGVARARSMRYSISGRTRGTASVRRTGSAIWRLQKRPVFGRLRPAAPRFVRHRLHLPRSRCTRFPWHTSAPISTAISTS